MDDEDLTHLNNFCADLVGSKRWEAFPIHLLIDKRAAEWVRVRDVCLQLGIPHGDPKLDPFAVWVPDPTGDEEYALILFYDEESMWSMTARYNRQRLLESVPRVAGDTGKRPASEQAYPEHVGQPG